MLLGLTCFQRAGDLGGYYGLCLGGSLVTIFELVDLIVYYSLAKLSLKRTRRETDDAKQGENQMSKQPNGNNRINRSDSGPSIFGLSSRWRPSYAATTDFVRPVDY